jgi:glycosyltransferase involved in cell wall biosynthesis
MTGQAPLLSIGIPTYRGAAHLGKTIESVLDQSFRDFEIVIVDDNSPDNTEEVIGKFQDPRIRYMRNVQNLGPQGNWNRVLNESRGKYFKLLPQDDLLMPGCLELQIGVLERDVEEHVALVFCARNIIGSGDRTATVRGYPAGKEGLIDGREVVRRCVRRGTNLIGEPGSGMMRRSLTQRIGPFDATNPYVIELDYWFRLLEHGGGYYFPQPLAAFRVSSGSWSVAISNPQSFDFRAFIARMSARAVYGLSRYDIVSGHVMAEVNNYLRLIYYRIVLN